MSIATDSWELKSHCVHTWAGRWQTRRESSQLLGKPEECNSIKVLWYMVPQKKTLSLKLTALEFSVGKQRLSTQRIEFTRVQIRRGTHQSRSIYTSSVQIRRGTHQSRSIIPRLFSGMNYNLYSVDQSLALSDRFIFLREH